MKKTTFIINGRGGCGKDTICNIVGKHYKTKVISFVDPVKKAAGILGWDGGKEQKDRKFLADIADLGTEYSDASMNYILEEYNQFIEDSELEVLFIHIRSPKEIQRFKLLCRGNVKTFIVTRPSIDKVKFENHADRDVYLYKYDIAYKNNLDTLEDLEKDVMPLIVKALDDVSEN
jgi:hypothetical protein